MLITGLQYQINNIKSLSLQSSAGHRQDRDVRNAKTEKDVQGIWGTCIKI